MKFFSTPNLDTYDTLLLIYDPSIEPKYQIDKVLNEEQGGEAETGAEEKKVKPKEYSDEEIKEIYSNYTEIMKKCKEGNMFSLLLVINTSLLKEEVDYHPIVQAY